MFVYTLLVAIIWLEPGTTNNYQGLNEEFPVQSFYDCTANKDKYIKEGKEKIYKQYNGIKIVSISFYCSKQILREDEYDTPIKELKPIESINPISADKRLRDTVLIF